LSPLSSRSRLKADEARDQDRDEELRADGLADRERTRDGRRRNDVAVAERRERDEAEIDRGVEVEHRDRLARDVQRTGLDAREPVVGQRERDAGEQVYAGRGEDPLARDGALAERHAQRGGAGEHGRQDQEDVARGEDGVAA